MKGRTLLTVMAAAAAVMVLPVSVQAKEYNDVTPGAWYYSNVSEIGEKGIMTGVGDGSSFEPGSDIPRAQFATVLYRMAGSPDVDQGGYFPDVPANQWYYNAVTWASQAGVAGGYDNGNFGPNDMITREQIAKMIYGYMEYMEYDVSVSEDLSGFPDGESVSDFAKEYMEWAVASGVISGKKDLATGEKYLDPQANASRAEIATMILRLLVPFDGAYVIDAQEALAKVGDPNVIFVDAGDHAGSETVKGAVVTGWKEWADQMNPGSRTGAPGWYHMKSAADMNEIFSSLGLSKDKEIILLGETKPGWGDDSRLLWQLRAAGYTEVKVVDGGYKALIAAGAPTQQGSSVPVRTDARVTEVDAAHVMTTEKLKNHYGEYKVIDVRDDAEYNGKQLFNEKAGGHLPGAIHLRYTDLFYADGTLRPVKELTKWFENAGLEKTDQIVCYCTGGIRSAYMQLVLEMCGYEKSYNYDESFWGWTETDGRLE